MFVKALLFFFIAAFVVQQNDALSLSMPDIDEVIKDAEDIAKKAAQKASEILSTVETYGEKYIKEAEEGANDFIAKTRSKFQTSVENSFPAKMLPQKCSQVYVSGSDQWAVSTTKSIAGCVTEKIAKAQETALGFTNVSKDINETISTFKDKIAAECIRADDSIMAGARYHACRASFATATTTRLLGAGVQFVKLVKQTSDITLFVVNIQTQLPLCVTARSTLAMVSFELLVKDIAICVLKETMG